MKNIIKTMLLSILILTTVSTNAQNLVLIKKDKFTSCEEMVYSGDYKGTGDYTLYDENENPYVTHCEIEILGFKQTNFSYLPSSTAAEMASTPHVKFKIYHSDDLYFIYEGKVTSDRQILLAEDAIETVNTNNVEIGTYVIIMPHAQTSGIITSNSSSGWCSPINGRYNGTCFNGSRGIGDWEIILIY